MVFRDYCLGRVSIQTGPVTHALGFLPACLILRGCCWPSSRYQARLAESTQVDLEKEHQVEMAVSIRQHWDSLAGDDRGLSRSWTLEGVTGSFTDSVSSTKRLVNVAHTMRMLGRRARMCEYTRL